MEQSIKIKIAEREFPLRVTSPQQEEDIRKAAQEINRQIQAYQSRYADKTLAEVLSIMALNVCVNNISLNRMVKGMKEAEDSLAKELDGYLDNIDKNSR
ncbi:MAG: cell division protein ZapA [Bacteroidales bacterium]|nr:cell division protein ZapA [Bacteroidales bacterium]